MRLTWTDLRHEHIAAINLPIVEYGGVQWVPLRQLAKELQVTPERLRKAVMSPGARLAIEVICLGLDRRQSELAVARYSLLLLAQRLRVGANNALLEFVNQAQAIAAMEDMAFLVRRNQRMKAKQREALSVRQRQMEAFVEGYDLARADRLDDARKRFTERTQLGPETLTRFLRKKYETAAARGAIAAIKSRDGAFQPPKIPRPKVSPVVIRWLLKGVDDGLSHADLAGKYGLTEATVRDIERDYHQKRGSHGFRRAPESWGERLPKS